MSNILAHSEACLLTVKFEDTFTWIHDRSAVIPRLRGQAVKINEAQEVTY